MKIATCCIALIVAIVLTAALPDRTAQETVTVKRSPTTPWIEVYHNGQLTSEWQPSDGRICDVLEHLLQDDLYSYLRPEPRQMPGDLIATRNAITLVAQSSFRNDS